MKMTDRDLIEAVKLAALEYGLMGHACLSGFPPEMDISADEYKQAQFDLAERCVEAVRRGLFAIRSDIEIREIFAVTQTNVPKECVANIEAH